MPRRHKLPCSPEPDTIAGVDRREPIVQIAAVAYKEAGLDYHVRMHSSRTSQLYGVVHGRVDMAMPGHTISLGPGDFILVPPGQQRSPRAAGKAPGYLYVVFRSDRLDLSALKGKATQLGERYQPDVQALIGEIRQPPAAYAEEMIAALATRVLIALCRAADAAPGPSRPAALNRAHEQRTIERLEGYMRRNLDRPLSREQVAHAAHLSPSHLARMMRRVRGVSLLERLARLRVDRAAQLLAESTLSVTEIALEVGYTSPSHFAQVFRRHMSVSPSDYRRRGASFNGPK